MTALQGAFWYVLQMRRRRLRGLTLPACNLLAKEQTRDHLGTPGSQVCLGGRTGAPLPLFPGSPTPADHPRRNLGQKASPWRPRADGRGKDTETGADACPLTDASGGRCASPARDQPVLRCSSTDPEAVPFSTAISLIQTAGTFCLDSHRSFQTALPTCVPSPTVHCQHSRVIP